MIDSARPFPATIQTSSPAAGGQSGDSQIGWKLFFILAGLLLLVQCFELPKIADWSLFAFFDPGTAFKGDVLISAGMRPAIDFGYTHGLASLIFAHWALKIFGRNPVGYILTTSCLEILMAGAITLFMRAMAAPRRAVIWLCCALPIAVMPAYLTLTHPLEATLLLWAIAMQARGNRRVALLLCTICLFVKPSMGYVYGLLLLILIFWDYIEHGKSVRSLIQELLPAVIGGIIVALGCIRQFGLRSLLLTILPITGLRTYTDTHFGFLFGRGQRFWSPEYHGPLYYFLTPAGIWLAMLLVIIWKLPRLLAQFRPGLPGRRAETLVCLGIMQLAFVFGFYGWRHSWEYYSYMPVLFLAGLLAMENISRRLLITACSLAILSQATTVAIAASGWIIKVRNRQTGGLWAYRRQAKEWNHVVQLTRDEPTLVLSNGFLPWMAPGMYMPSSWFPEPGITTPPELRRIERQTDRALFVVTWRSYGNKGMWHQRVFRHYRRQFIPLWRGRYMTVWVRLQAVRLLGAADVRLPHRLASHHARGPMKISPSTRGDIHRPDPASGFHVQTRP